MAIKCWINNTVKIDDFHKNLYFIIPVMDCLSIGDLLKTDLQLINIPIFMFSDEVAVAARVLE
jgi:hypothetical protein